MPVGGGAIRLKAVRIVEHGGPEALQYGDVPDPQVGPREVLVRLRAAGVNHLDIWNRRGSESRRVPLPLIPGADGAGVIAGVGEDAGPWSVGQEVIIHPGISCGRCPACLAGRDTFCPSYEILGNRRAGTYAEYVVVPAENVLPKPEGLSFTEAAALPLVYLTAWHMLVSLARIRPGESVLVVGAGSGVGTAAVQIALAWGARVYATAGGEAKCRQALALGVHAAIDHQRCDVANEIQRMTGGRGVDVALDHAGGRFWESALQSLAPGGRLVCCGDTLDHRAQVDVRVLFFRQLQVFGALMGSKGEMWEVLSLAAAGKLRPVIDRVYPLHEAAEAHRRVESRQHFGKVVLVPTGQG